EPTAHLDPVHAARVRAVLADLRAGRLPDGRRVRAILLAASHDRDLSALADAVHRGAQDPPPAPAPLHSSPLITAPVDPPPGPQAAPGAVGPGSHPVSPVPSSPDRHLPDRHPTPRLRLREVLRLLPLTDRRFVAGVL